MAERIDEVLLSGLLGLLVHDLRNPLSALSSNLGYLADELPDRTPEADEALDDLLLSCEGLSHIVDGVEALARLLSDSKTEALAPVAASTVLVEAVERMTPTARSHSVRVVADPTVLHSPERVRINQGMFHKALGALLRNSVQHAPPGSEVRLGFSVSAEAVVFRIEDDGPKTPPDSVERAFSPQGQLDAKRCNSGRYSRGLGLLCARIWANASGAEVTLLPSAVGNVFELRTVRSSAG